MSLAHDEDFGAIIAPRTLQMQRLLPGPIERVWDYLTKSDLRRQWLSSGEMPMKVNVPFELVWHHDELTTPPGTRPDGMGPQTHMPTQLTHCEPPHKLGFLFMGDSEVIFELKPAGAKVLLTLTHRNLPSRGMMVGVSTGWHTHLDVLAARLAQTKIENFWDHWRGYKAEYDKRIPSDA